MSNNFLNDYLLLIERSKYELGNKKQQVFERALEQLTRQLGSLHPHVLKWRAVARQEESKKKNDRFNAWFDDFAVDGMSEFLLELDRNPQKYSTQQLLDLADETGPTYRRPIVRLVLSRSDLSEQEFRLASALLNFPSKAEYSQELLSWLLKGNRIPYDRAYLLVTRDIANPQVELKAKHWSAIESVFDSQVVPDARLGVTSSPASTPHESALTMGRILVLDEKAISFKNSDIVSRAMIRKILERNPDQEDLARIGNVLSGVKTDSLPTAGEIVEFTRKAKSVDDNLIVAEWLASRQSFKESLPYYERALALLSNEQIIESMEYSYWLLRFGVAIERSDGRSNTDPIYAAAGAAMSAKTSSSTSVQYNSLITCLQGHSIDFEDLQVACHFILNPASIKKLLVLAKGEPIPCKAELDFLSDRVLQASFISYLLLSTVDEIAFDGKQLLETTDLVLKLNQEVIAKSDFKTCFEQLTLMASFNQRNGNLVEAEKVLLELESIMDRSPIASLENKIEWLVRMSELCQLRENFASAKSYLNEASACAKESVVLTKDDKVLLLKKLALCHMNLGDRKRALECIEAYITETPSGHAYEEALLIKGHCLLDEGQISEAKKVLELVKESPYDKLYAQANFLMGKALYEEGFYRDASNVLRDSIRANAMLHDPEDSLLRSALLLRSLINSDEYEQANSISRDIRDRLGNYTKAINQLSFAEQQIKIDRLKNELAFLLSISKSSEELQQNYDSLSMFKGVLINSLMIQAKQMKLGEDRFGTLIIETNGIRDKISKIRAGLSNVVPTDLEKLLSRKEQIERAVYSSLPEDVFEGSYKDISKTAAQNLEEDETFVDLFVYKDSSNTAQRYGAIVLTKSQPLNFIDIGDFESIRTAVQEWRVSCIGSERGRSIQLADQAPSSAQVSNDRLAKLRILVSDKVIAGIPSTTNKIWLSEDGVLARLPWSVMVNTGDGSRVFDVSQLAGLRDLLYLKNNKSQRLQKTLLLVGDIAFRDSENHLKGSSLEIDDIYRLAVKAKYKTSVLRQATPNKKAIVESINGRRIVHLATHGFFRTLEDDAPKIFRGDGGAFSISGLAKRMTLMDSGILVAPESSTEIGESVLTAEEFLQTDLSSCDLVVFSACESGRGYEVIGQGVLGLRAALRAAGAKTVLLSLWPVPDSATRALMTKFYELLLDEKGRYHESRCLREAQMLFKKEHPEWASPWYWAGWSIVGEAW
ncbi:CHAT domain-containing protein [Candidatus Obscuribacterales bacterium]|nr:CHAT domain-containing protein [Candidatus Obscuribacterales bacterium]